MSFIPQPCLSLQSGLIGCQGPSTVSTVGASITTVTIVAANPDRCSLLIFNDSTSTLRIKWGMGASLNDYTLQISGNGTYTMEPPVVYTGIITGIWDTANGDAHITEVT